MNVAKQAVLRILQNTIGKYVSNLDVNSLNVGLWSGEVNVNDLKIKEDALQFLGVPVRIIRGHIGKVRVQIPWTRLTSQPIKIDISDVFGVVVLDSEHFARSSADLREQQLDVLEVVRQQRRAINKSTGKDASDAESFLSRLTRLMVENLQLSLSQIHLRFEDPYRDLAVGLCLHALSIQSTDAQGNAGFVDRAESMFLHKSVSMAELALYCDTQGCTMVCALDSNSWLATLLTLTPSPASQRQARRPPYPTPTTPTNTPAISGALTHDYLLSPVSIEVHVVKNNSVHVSSWPRYHCESTVPSVAVCVNAVQFRLLCQIHSALFPPVTNAIHRSLRPLSSARQRWFMIAAHFVTKSPHSPVLVPQVAAKQKSLDLWIVFLKAFRVRKRYIRLFKRSQKLPWLKPLTPEEQSELRRIEMSSFISVSGIMEFRNLADAEVEKERAKMRQRERSADGTTAATPVAAQSLLSDQERDEIHRELVLETEQARVLTSSAVIWEVVVLVDSINLALAESNTAQLVSASVQRVRYRTTLTKELTQSHDVSVATIAMHDRSSEGTLYPQLLRMTSPQLDPGSGAGQSSPARSRAHGSRVQPPVPGQAPTQAGTLALDLSVQYFPKSRNLSVGLNMAAFEIVLVRPFIERVRQCFRSSLPSEDIAEMMEAASEKLRDWRELQQTRLAEKWNQRNQWEINIAIDAPFVIVPYDHLSPRGGIVVFDLGRFTLKDTPHSGSGTMDRWECRLESIQMLLGSSIGFWRQSQLSKSNLDGSASPASPMHRESLRVVEPFSIILKLSTNRNASASESRSKVEGVLPSLAINLTSNAFQTLMLFATPKNRPPSTPSTPQTPTQPVPDSPLLPFDLAGATQLPPPSTSPPPATASEAALLFSWSMDIQSVAIVLSDSNHKLCTLTGCEVAWRWRQYRPDRRVVHVGLRSLRARDELVGVEAVRDLLSSGGGMGADAAEAGDLVSVAATLSPGVPLQLAVKLDRAHINWNPRTIQRLQTLFVVLPDVSLSGQPSSEEVKRRVSAAWSNRHRTPTKRITKAVRAPMVTPGADTISGFRLSFQLQCLSLSLNYDDDQESGPRRLMLASMTNSTMSVERVGEGDTTVEGSLGSLKADMEQGKFHELIRLKSEGDLVSVSARFAQRGKALLDSGYRSRVSVRFAPVDMVYSTQWVQQVTSYVRSGVMGVMLGQSAQAMSSTTIRDHQGPQLIEVTAAKPRILLPQHLHSSSRFELGCESIHASVVLPTQAQTPAASPVDMYDCGFACSRVTMTSFGHEVSEMANFDMEGKVVVSGVPAHWRYRTALTVPRAVVSLSRARYELAFSTFVGNILKRHVVGESVPAVQVRTTSQHMSLQVRELELKCLSGTTPLGNIEVGNLGITYTSPVESASPDPTPRDPPTAAFCVSADALSVHAAVFPNTGPPLLTVTPHTTPRESLSGALRIGLELSEGGLSYIRGQVANCMLNCGPRALVQTWQVLTFFLLRQSLSPIHPDHQKRLQLNRVASFELHNIVLIRTTHSQMHGTRAARVQGSAHLELCFAEKTLEQVKFTAEDMTMALCLWVGSRDPNVSAEQLRGGLWRTTCEGISVDSRYTLPSVVPGGALDVRVGEMVCAVTCAGWSTLCEVLRDWDTGSVGEDTRVVDIAQWICPSCALLNASTMQSCQACGFEIGAPPQSTPNHDTPPTSREHSTPDSKAAIATTTIASTTKHEVFQVYEPDETDLVPLSGPALDPASVPLTAVDGSEEGEEGGAQHGAPPRMQLRFEVGSLRLEMLNTETPLLLPLFKVETGTVLATAAPEAQNITVDLQASISAFDERRLCWVPTLIPWGVECAINRPAPGEPRMVTVSGTTAEVSIQQSFVDNVCAMRRQLAVSMDVLSPGGGAGGVSGPGQAAVMLGYYIENLCGMTLDVESTGMARTPVRHGDRFQVHFSDSAAIEAVHLFDKQLCTDRVVKLYARFNEFTSSHGVDLNTARPRELHLGVDGRGRDVVLVADTRYSQGAVTLQLTSRIEIVNTTDLPIYLHALVDGVWRAAGLAGAGGVCFVPIMLAHCTALAVSSADPAHLGLRASAPKTAPRSHIGLDSSKAAGCVLLSPSSREIAVSLSIHSALRQCQQKRVILAPTLVFESAMPGLVTLALQCPGAGNPGVEWRLLVPGAQVFCYSPIVDVEAFLCLEGGRTSSPVKLFKGGSVSLPKPVHLEFANGATVLVVLVHRQADTGTHHFSITCEHVIVNHTPRHIALTVGGCEWSCVGHGWAPWQVKPTEEVFAGLTAGEYNSEPFTLSQLNFGSAGDHKQLLLRQGRGQAYPVSLHLEVDGQSTCLVVLPTFLFGNSLAHEVLLREAHAEEFVRLAPHVDGIHLDWERDTCDRDMVIATSSLTAESKPFRVDRLGTQLVQLFDRETGQFQEVVPISTYRGEKCTFAITIGGSVNRVLSSQPPNTGPKPTLTPAPSHPHAHTPSPNPRRQSLASTQHPRTQLELKLAVSDLRVSFGMSLLAHTTIHHQDGRTPVFALLQMHGMDITYRWSGIGTGLTAFVTNILLMSGTSKRPTPVFFPERLEQSGHRDRFLKLVLQLAPHPTIRRVRILRLKARDSGIHISEVFAAQLVEVVGQLSRMTADFSQSGVGDVARGIGADTAPATPPTPTAPLAPAALCHVLRLVVYPMTVRVSFERSQAAQQYTSSSHTGGMAAMLSALRFRLRDAVLLFPRVDLNSMEGTAKELMGVVRGVYTREVGRQWLTLVLSSSLQSWRDWAGKGDGSFLGELTMSAVRVTTSLITSAVMSPFPSPLSTPALGAKSDGVSPTFKMHTPSVRVCVRAGSFSSACTLSEFSLRAPGAYPGDTILWQWQLDSGAPLPPGQLAAEISQWSLPQQRVLFERVSEGSITHSRLPAHPRVFVSHIFLRTASGEELKDDLVLEHLKMESITLTASFVSPIGIGSSIQPRRNSTASSTPQNLLDLDTRMPTNGYVIAWEVFVVESGEVRLQVWRAGAGTGAFTLVGEHRAWLPCPGPHMLHSVPIACRGGDIVGWVAGGPGLAALCWDTSNHTVCQVAAASHNTSTCSLEGTFSRSYSVKAIFVAV